MRQYYYTVSTLPLLAYDSEHVPDSHEFLDLCGRELSPSDYALLLQARLEPFRETETDPKGVAAGLDADPSLDGAGAEAGGREVLRSWINWERALRNELVRLRAARLEVDGAPYLAESSFVSGLSEVCREAANAESPLEGEHILNRARWAKLDELETGHSFDIVKIIIYSLRIQLLERKAQFTRERGEERFDALYATIMEESSPSDLIGLTRESEE